MGRAKSKNEFLLFFLFRPRGPKPKVKERPEYFFFFFSINDFRFRFLFVGLISQEPQFIVKVALKGEAMMSEQQQAAVRRRGGVFGRRTRRRATAFRSRERPPHPPWLSFCSLGINAHTERRLNLNDYGISGKEPFRSFVGGG
jgi:hypothetical protein